jgi:hypothetical protein
MTYDEYKALYKEWSDTDSKTPRSEEIEEKIEFEATVLLGRLVSEYKKRGKEFYEGLRNSTRGQWFIDNDNMYYESVYLINPDWRQFSVRVPMKYLDEEEFDKLDSSLRQEQLEKLEEEDYHYKYEIERMQRKLAECEQKIAKLQEEMEND